MSAPKNVCQICGDENGDGSDCDECESCNYLMCDSCTHDHGLCRDCAEEQGLVDDDL